MKDTRHTGCAKGGPVEGPDAATPLALDDDTFVRTMEDSFAASKRAGGHDGEIRDGGGAPDADTAMRDRVWEKLQARMAAEELDSRSDPAPMEGATPARMAPVATSASSSAPTNSRIRWGVPLVGLAGLAAAAILFVRMGGNEGGLVLGNPSDLKGGEVAAPRTTLEARYDPTARVYSFHATSVPAAVGAGVVLFASAGGSPAVVARGRLAPEGGDGPRTLIGEAGDHPVTWAPPGGDGPVAGRLCLFTSEGDEGLRAVEELAPTVFERQDGDLCQDVRVP